MSRAASYPQSLREPPEAADWLIGCMTSRARERGLYVFEGVNSGIDHRNSKVLLKSPTAKFMIIETANHRAVSRGTGLPNPFRETKF